MQDLNFLYAFVILGIVNISLGIITGVVCFLKEEIRYLIYSIVLLTVGCLTTIPIIQICLKIGGFHQ